jgi:hypothetical protein
MKNDTGSQENENNCYDPRDAVDFSHIGPELKDFVEQMPCLTKKRIKKQKRRQLY